MANNWTVPELNVANRKTLDAIFLEGETPSIAEMVGVVDGSVGSLKYIPDLKLLRKFINLGWVPWRGKIFYEVSPTESKGINRFRVWPFKFLRYRCETTIKPPLVGPNDVYCLNYDLPGNPGIIRRVRDDIKRVGDGVYLGSANMRLRGKQRFVAYFILKATGRTE